MADYHGIGTVPPVTHGGIQLKSCWRVRSALKIRRMSAFEQCVLFTWLITQPYTQLSPFLLFFFGDFATYLPEIQVQLV